MKWQHSLLTLILIFSATVANAMTLDGLRKTGEVGEGRDGYVHAQTRSEDIVKFVAEVNAKRMEEYDRISKQNGQTRAVVAKLAVPQIIAKLPAGAKYESENGKYVTK